MRRALKSTAAALCLYAALAGSLSAQGVPVYDATSVFQLIEQITHQLEQLATAKAQLESMIGGRGISDILNTAADRAAREAAVDVKSIIDGAISGRPIAGNTAIISARLEDLRNIYELAALPDFLASDIPQDRALATLGGSGMAAMATADDSYARANTAMGRAGDLIDQIDANPDLKASVDFNTRMLAEVLAVLNESLRLQAAMANSLGSQALHQARDGVAAREFMTVGEGR